MTTLAPPEAPPTTPVWTTPATPSNPDADLIEKAADYIDEHGWTQGCFVDREGRVCAYGALYAVSGEYSGGPFTRPATVRGGQLAMLVEAELLGIRAATPLAHYNDFLAKTKEDITGLFRRVATKLRSTS